MNSGGVAGHAPLDQGRSGADEIRHGEHRFGTFRMRHHFGARMLRLRLRQPPRREGGMHDAGALPDLHVLAPGLLLHVVAQIAVRQEEHGLFRRNRIDDLHGIARGAKNVALRLHLDRRIDVADDHVLGMLAAELAHRFDRAALHQAATGLAIGHHDGAGRVQHLGGFRHEPDAAEGDHVAREIARLAGQFQAVADDVGQFLNLRFLVMMRQQNRAALLLQFQNLVGDGSGGQHGK